MALTKRKLGKQGLEVSAIGLSCMSDDIIPSPCTKHRTYLEEYLAAALITLDASHIKKSTAGSPVLKRTLTI